MKPRGPLMIEHRLIERILLLVDEEIEKIRKNQTADPVFIDTIVDFIRTYADRTHHGKEEDILFKDLEKKKLDAGDKKMMDELIEEHKYGRKTTLELVKANEGYANGNYALLPTIIEKMTNLACFYPGHIIKEDKIFFPNTEKYFTETELEDMLKRFWEFDRKMIHEKYDNLYNTLLERSK